MEPEELLRKAYVAFNARDIDGALALMHSDVAWPNSMEGGTLHGHDGVRAYWSRQWSIIKLAAVAGEPERTKQRE